MRGSSTRLGWLAVAVVTLVLAHEVVFLVGFGSTFGSALALSGHDARWTRAVLAVLFLGAALLLAAAWRLYALGALARNLGVARSGPVTAGELHWSALARNVVRSWLPLAGSTLILFVFQENAERIGAGQPAPGLAVLRSSENPDSWLVVLAIAFAVAFVAALFRWRRDALMAQIAEDRQSWPRHQDAARLPRGVAIERRRASPMGRRQALRAPPAFS